MLAVSAQGLLAGCPASEALFKGVARFKSRHVHYQSGPYKNPWEKDEAAVRDISTSFKKRRKSFNDGLKERALLEGAPIVNKSCEEGRGSDSLRSTKPKGKSKTKAAARARAKSAALGAAQADVMAERVALETIR